MYLLSHATAARSEALKTDSGVDHFARAEIAYYVQHDAKAAIAAYQAAAGSGHVPALFRLARLHHAGQATTRNFPLALSHYQRAAELGHARANFFCGMFYSEGTEVPKDVVVAERYIRRGAEAGDADAQALLAYWYQSGEIVPSNLGEAWFWYARAEQSVQRFRQELAEKSPKLERDRNEEFYELSDQIRNLSNMAEIRDLVASQLTPQELALAQSRLNSRSKQ